MVQEKTAGLGKHQEIERKFLIRPDAWPTLDLPPGERIRQGYLNLERCDVWIQTRERSGERWASLAVTGQAHGYPHARFNYALSADEAMSLAVDLAEAFHAHPNDWPLLGTPSERIRQACFAHPEAFVARVRLAESADGSRAFLTIKGRDRDGQHPEYEYVIPVPDAMAMLADLADRVIEKVRFRLRVGRHVWEIDAFQGRHAGFLLAEVELADRGEWVEIPSWAGREVTGLPEYQNSYLAKAERLPPAV